MRHLVWPAHRCTCGDSPPCWWSPVPGNSCSPAYFWAASSVVQHHQRISGHCTSFQNQTNGNLPHCNKTFIWKLNLCTVHINVKWTCIYFLISMQLHRYLHIWGKELLTIVQQLPKYDPILFTLVLWKFRVETIQFSTTKKQVKLLTMKMKDIYQLPIICFLPF